MASTNYDNNVRQLINIADIYGLHQLISEPTRITDKSSTRGHNRFGGMRDLAIFCGDTRDASSKQEREAGILIASGSGISYFYELGMRET